jgi:F0F1-type ATP synthase assembly protein I
MADKINPTARPKAMQNETQEALEKQVAELRREFAKINKMLIDRSKEAAGQVNALPTQAQSVSEVVRANPGTLSSAMIVGILIGFAVGFVVGQSQVTGSRHRWY